MEVLATQRTDPDPDFLDVPRDAGPALQRTGLLTYGAQLQWAYARLFPHYVGYPVLRQTYRETVDGRWRTLYRYTDPLGGPVLSWPADGSPAPQSQPVEWATVDDGTAELLQPGPGIAGRVGPDIRLRDPVHVETAADAVRAPIQDHGGYYTDPVFPDFVLEVAHAPAAPTG